MSLPITSDSTLFQFGGRSYSHTVKNIGSTTVYLRATSSPQDDDAPYAASDAQDGRGATILSGETWVAEPSLTYARFYTLTGVTGTLDIEVGVDANSVYGGGASGGGISRLVADSDTIAVTGTAQSISALLTPFDGVLTADDNNAATMRITYSGGGSGYELVAGANSTRYENVILSDIQATGTAGDILWIDGQTFSA